MFYGEVKWSEVTQSCPILCDPMDCNLLGSSVYGILQARVLESIAISFSSGSSQPRDRTQVSRTVDRRFTVWAAREVLCKEFYALEMFLVYQSEKIIITQSENVCESCQLFGYHLESIFIWFNITLGFGKSFQFFSILKGNMK